MRSFRGVLVFAVLVATIGTVSVQWVGCSDGDDNFRFHVNGNVDSVTGGSAAVRPESKPLFASATGFFLGVAEAQNGECSGRILACIGEEGGNAQDRLSCQRVDAGNCRFAVSLRLAQDGIDPFIFFCDDADNDGECSASDELAELTNDLGRPMCNGDQVRLNDVDVDFDEQEATAADVDVSQPSACGATPVPTVTGTPEPTVTGTPPTATPEPTVTGTPPTPTPEPTPTPCDLCGTEPCCGSCVPGLNVCL